MTKFLVCWFGRLVPLIPLLLLKQYHLTEIEIFVKFWSFQE